MTRAGSRILRSIANAREAALDAPVTRLTRVERIVDETQPDGWACFVAIPKDIVERLGLRDGDEMEAEVSDGRIELRKRAKP